MLAVGDGITWVLKLVELPEDDGPKNDANVFVAAEAVGATETPLEVVDEGELNSPEPDEEEGLNNEKPLLAEVVGAAVDFGTEGAVKANGVALEEGAPKPLKPENLGMPGVSGEGAGCTGRSTGGGTGAFAAALANERLGKPLIGLLANSASSAFLNP